MDNVMENKMENKKCHGMILERKDPWHHKDSEGVWSASLFRNANKIDETNTWKEVHGIVGTSAILKTQAERINSHGLQCTR